MGVRMSSSAEPGDLARSRIKALRLRRGMTQEALCEAAGISVDAVTRIEGGSRDPSLATLAKIAAALDVRVVDLLETGKLPRRTLPAPLARLVDVLAHEPLATQEAVEQVARILIRAFRRPARPRVR